jgi:ribosomal protein S18 acetylase RimI-like enzyme
VEVILARGAAHVDAVADIWARATAARDGDQEAAGLQESRPVIESVLGSSPRAVLVIALEGEKELGFAAVTPLDGEHASTAEVRYLGVEPDAWGRGVGRALMAALPGELRALGFERARLSVYTDNERAVDLYVRAGWRPDGPFSVHPRTGKTEQGYQLDLRAAASQQA